MFLSNCSLLRVIVFVNNPISTATATTAIKNNYIEGKTAPQGLGFPDGQKQKYMNDLERLIRQ